MSTRAVSRLQLSLVIECMRAQRYASSHRSEPQCCGIPGCGETSQKAPQRTRRLQWVKDKGDLSGRTRRMGKGHMRQGEGLRATFLCDSSVLGVVKSVANRDPVKQEGQLAVSPGSLML